MLSRAALLSAQRPMAALAVRATSSAASGQTMERPVRAELPGKVRIGFLPDEWFQFFYNKTGVTGPYVFGAGLFTYLASKEIYVMEHEYYSGLSLGIMLVVAIKKLGPSIAAYCDKEIDRIEGEWKSSRETNIQDLNEAVEEEKKEQWRAEGQIDLMTAKKDNVGLQLEATYRERCMAVYNDVKRRLDYQVEVQHVDRRINQKHMVDWIVNGVLKSVTPESEKATLNQCIVDLNNLAARK